MALEMPDVWVMYFGLLKHWFPLAVMGIVGDRAVRFHRALKHKLVAPGRVEEIGKGAASDVVRFPREEHAGDDRAVYGIAVWKRG